MGTLRLFGIAIYVTAVIFHSAICQDSEENNRINLGYQNVFRDRITVSGFSSGGTMAQMMQIAHSAIINGAAVFSHAFYRCGPGDGDADVFDNQCTLLGPASLTTTPYDPARSVAEIVTNYANRLIDDPNNLRNKRLYVYTGTKNALFRTETSLGILNVFEPFIQNASAIRTRVQVAELVLPSNSYGGPCHLNASSTFYVANCGFNGAFDALNFILGGGLKEPKATKADTTNLLAFDQSEFFLEEDVRHDMDSEGYIYMPSKCKNKKCLLHIYFHGCLVGREFHGINHIRNSGYLQVAEANDIIMVFPQALKSSDNDWGCWDTYGFTGQLYATKRGAQVRVVRNIISKLIDEPRRTRSHSQTNREIVEDVSHGRLFR